MLVHRKQYFIRKLQPFGVLLQMNDPIPLAQLNSDSLHDYVNQYHLVLVRGAVMPEKEGLLTFAETLGPLLQWEFGAVMEMRADEKPTNYLFTHGPVPLHWDGAFQKVPHLLLFHCIHAPNPLMGGETIFINTEKILQKASPAERQYWEQLSLTYSTEKKAHYGGTITESLISEHPITRKSILRFAEPVDPPMLNPVSVKVNELVLAEGKQFIEEMASRCYQPTYSYSHQWQQNDFLLSDNYSLLHARRAFSEFTPRHLRRIQVMRG